MFQFNKSKARPAPEQDEDFAKGRAQFDDWAKTIKLICNEQLSELRNFVDGDWDEAERSGNLSVVIGRYCGALEGTEERTNQLFKQLEDIAAGLQLAPGAEDYSRMVRERLLLYTQVKKFEHIRQIRAYLDSKLKLSLVSAGPKREELRKFTLKFLSDLHEAAKTAAREGEKDRLRELLSSIEADRDAIQTNPANLDSILELWAEFRNKEMPLVVLKNIRHMLTANIQKNLYNSPSKEEGRRALHARNTLDNAVLNVKPEDVQGGNTEDAVVLGKAIKAENLAELMEILENVVTPSDITKQDIRNGIKDIVSDPDKLQRFSRGHQKIIQAAARSFFPKAKIKKAILLLGKEVGAIGEPKQPGRQRWLSPAPFTLPAWPRPAPAAWVAIWISIIAAMAWAGSYPH